MRTQEPKNIRTDFDAALKDVVSTFHDSSTLSSPKSKRLVAEYSFLASATLLEGFVSDLFVAYINRRFDRFRDHLTNQMNIEATDEYACRARKFASPSIRHRLNVDKIREILDPNSYHVTFRTTDEMKKAAGLWLAKQDEPKFTGLRKDQCAVIDLTKAVRNHLAHRSRSSSKLMQAALVAADIPPELQRTGKSVSNVGAYLSALRNGVRRFDHYVRFLKAIAQTMCP